MHELSIADAIVSVALRHAGGRRVARVEVKIGHLRQVVPGALELAFTLVAEGTEVEGAELAIVDVPVRVECRRCAAEAEVDDFPLACAGCGTLEVDVVAGQELEVQALEVESEEIAGVRR